MLPNTLLQIRSASNEELEKILLYPDGSVALAKAALTEYSYRVALDAVMDTAIQKKISIYFQNPISGSIG